MLKRLNEGATLLALSYGYLCWRDAMHGGPL